MPRGLPRSAFAAAVLQFSGFADIAIGNRPDARPAIPGELSSAVSRRLGPRFWRRWHITSIIWLRDYLGFPIAGRDAPTLRLLPNIMAGFALLGFWYGGGETIALWAAYSSAFLALEAVGLGPRLARWPKLLQRGYTLLVMMIGWVILRSDSSPVCDGDAAGDGGSERVCADGESLPDAAGVDRSRNRRDWRGADDSMDEPLARFDRRADQPRPS